MKTDIAPVDAPIDAHVAAPGTGGVPPLRVLVLNSVLTGGGVDSHTLSLCRALVAQGLDVRLAMPTASRWLERAQAIEGLQLIVIGVRRLWWPVIIARHLRHDRVQVVHAHHGRDYWLAIAAAWLAGRGTRVVVTRHLMNAMKAKTRRYLAPTATVVAVSDAVAHALAQDDPQRTLRVRRIHCAIDTAEFRPDAAAGERMRAALGWPAEALVFAVVGAIHAPEGKGQLYFLAAAARVRAAYPEAYFLCIGSGELVPALEQEAQRLGLGVGPGAHFQVQPFNTDIAAWMQAIDVLVHPAVGSEALGLVILEALACGKPVIASRLGGISETFIAGEHGLLVEPRDVEGLAQAMRQLAADPALRQAMGAAGRDWVETHFSLPRLGEDTEHLYRECLAQGR
jgi:glycosyltransferase involved in cell wall biosynthesis